MVKSRLISLKIYNPTITAHHLRAFESIKYILKYCRFIQERRKFVYKIVKQIFQVPYSFGISWHIHLKL